jgi:hypothetical protein
MNYISPDGGNAGRAGMINSAAEIAPIEVTGRGGDLGGAGASCCLPHADNKPNNRVVPSNRVLPCLRFLQLPEAF